MKNIMPFAFAALMSMGACKSSEPTQQQSVAQQQEQQLPALPAFDTEGHRGARGLMPENTIPAMRKAIDLGMTTIEMDCHITKDRKVVVTHDPHINPAYARTPDGRDFTKEESKNYAIYQMDYAEVRKFDMGTKFYDLYPQQQKMEAYIPLLEELIDSVQNYLEVKGLPQVFYNIETKSVAKNDNQLHPEPAVFMDLMVEVIERKGITPWVIIQSFDPRTLQELNKRYPHIRTSLLVSNQDTFEQNIERLGFIPVVYSPNYKLVTAELLQKCHEKQIKVIPWTVNTAEEIARLRALGVDGIITDYPNLLSTLN
ncbi:glycerophosphodiester phosphodiesterase [uncultured Pontibacter sp.]|uniref:glycerophosphodiester phosphodiesterase n=1 Tax=uncultured Pontibacter sp. TaxID=453356 RepID=UPI0026079D2D|nr:glycerophosphodiester phosphodiesterase [uncultured Pontibacter sp.]